MKIAYQDLISCLAEKPSKQILSEKLFQLGHEHEIHGDVFDMELTPNRGDCLSLLGLARDLNIFFGESKNIDLFQDDIDELKINFENLAPSDCPNISFLEIEIDDITNSYEPYLENYFNVIGHKKTNFFTDISNYVSYELGQPTHCFERGAIHSNGRLTFENKNCNETFNTVLGSKIDLKDKNCVFSLDGQIISLAGVMGGASTACSDSTKKVLVECAYFNPESIIGKSIKYNLISDAAYKFERGVDIESHEMVLRRFIKIVLDHAKIKSIKMNSFSEYDLNKLPIPIDHKKINNILGTKLDKDEYLKYLEYLNFNISDELITPPSYRHDIKTNNDIAEEIARVIGYNNIDSSPINLKKIIGLQDKEKVAKLESFLTKNGFSEVINYPFSSKQENKSINVDNPLDSNRHTLRVSLKDSLIDNLLYNERRQKDSIKLFEISDIYTKNNRIKKQKRLGIIISGRLGNNHRDFSKKLDYKYLNKLLNNSTDNFFKIIEIPRNVLDSKRKEKIFYVEIPIEDIADEFLSNIQIENKTINFICYKSVSEYPTSTRDFSFSINDISKLDLALEMLNNISDELIKTSFIFDFYKDKKLKIIKLGYRIIFQSNFKTLSDLEINNKVKEILNPILEIEGINIPGM